MYVRMKLVLEYLIDNENGGVEACPPASQRGDGSARCSALPAPAPVKGRLNAPPAKRIATTLLKMASFIHFTVALGFKSNYNQGTRVLLHDKLMYNLPENNVHNVSYDDKFVYILIMYLGYYFSLGT